MCEIWGRLTFLGAENAAPMPCVVVYLGKDPSVFHRVFWDFGTLTPPALNIPSLMLEDQP